MPHSHFENQIEPSDGARKLSDFQYFVKSRCESPVARKAAARCVALSAASQNVISWDPSGQFKVIPTTRPTETSSNWTSAVPTSGKRVTRSKEALPGRYAKYTLSSRYGRSGYAPLGTDETINYLLRTTGGTYQATRTPPIDARDTMQKSLSPDPLPPRSQPACPRSPPDRSQAPACRPPICPSAAPPPFCPWFGPQSSAAQVPQTITRC